MKKIVLVILVSFLLVLAVACTDTADTTALPETSAPASTHAEVSKSYPNLVDVAVSGIQWNEDQMLPWFPEATGGLKAFYRDYFEGEELLSVMALQGIVNKTETRLMVLENSEEGATAWSSKIGKNVRTISEGAAMKTIAEFAKEASGVILYSPAKSEHYRNLAITLAGLKNAIPMTPEVHAAWQAAGVELDVIENLIPLSYTSAVDIYTYLYNTYWKDCEKRLLVSLDPANTYNLHDYSVGVGAATVYLDCMNAEEKAVFEKFLQDMKPGNGVVMGWFTSERSGISTVASNGLCSVPADFFNNASVYSSLSHTIRIDEVPDMPELSNKTYVMIVVSDGDNIQYNQHAMRLKWNSGRGKVPINWTISPALYDIAPNILNYYYSSATANDCLICGPSGYGYNLFYNTLWENGAPVGDYMASRDHLKAYVSVTDRYLERCGLRVATIWDKATLAQMNVYTKDASYLWGLTVQDFNNQDKKLTAVVNGKLIQQVLPSYATSLDQAYNSLVASMLGLDKSKPQFLALQISVWAEDFSANGIADLETRLQKIYPNVEFVRADHFYALYSEANGLDFNLMMSSGLGVTADGNTLEKGYLTDGSRSKLWAADRVGATSLTFSLGGTYDLSRLVLYHAETAGKNPLLNTRAFSVAVSRDGVTFEEVKTVEDNTDAISKLAIDEKGVTHVRITVRDGGDDGVARLADVEIYGSVAK
ncbi:MAG: discoidin domain-containing protein [Clostridia bacterium]|nr:discoidin domain-containing protein [Clostridia bacterium]